MVNILERLKSDSGFMGETHATSGAAVYLLLIALFPDIMFSFLQTNDIFIVLMGLVLTIGAAIGPDLDNVQSTARSSLGFTGKFVSQFMRFTSTAIYYPSKTKYDDPIANPHRGFWHTILSAILIFLLVLALSSMSLEITVFSKTYTLGFLFVMFFVFLFTNFSFAATIGKRYKNRKSYSKTTNTIFSLIVTILIFILAPSDLSYQWVAFSIGFGWLIHILGDACTVAGVPLFFPFKFKGKRWYVWRIPFAIKAGGSTEKLFILPMFMLIAIVSAVKVFLLLI